MLATIIESVLTSAPDRRRLLLASVPITSTVSRLWSSASSSGIGVGVGTGVGSGVGVGVGLRVGVGVGLGLGVAVGEGDGVGVEVGVGSGVATGAHAPRSVRRMAPIASIPPRRRWNGIAPMIEATLSACRPPS
jgi:hypothetical protein